MVPATTTDLEVAQRGTELQFAFFVPRRHHRRAVAARARGRRAVAHDPTAAAAGRRRGRDRRDGGRRGAGRRRGADRRRAPGGGATAHFPVPVPPTDRRDTDQGRGSRTGGAASSFAPWGPWRYASKEPSCRQRSAVIACCCAYHSASCRRPRFPRRSGSSRSSASSRCPRRAAWARSYPTWSRSCRARRRSRQARSRFSPAPMGVNVIWRADDPPVGFRVYRRDAASRAYGVPIAQPEPDARSHLDGTASFDSRYVYSVTTVALESPLVESTLTAEREVQYEDRYPPAPPTGLIVLAEPDRARLLWEPSAAGDLAGYLVYRRIAGRCRLRPPDGRTEPRARTPRHHGRQRPRLQLLRQRSRPQRQRERGQRDRRRRDPVTDYFRLSGGGNDFLALVEPGREPSADQIRAWCARGLSLGADGLFLLRRSPAGARMDYFNADGRPAALCVNGTRCAARLALELGWAADDLVVETGAGPVAARRAADDAIALTLPVPTAPAERPGPGRRRRDDPRLAASRSACRTSSSSGRAPSARPRWPTWGRRCAATGLLARPAPTSISSAIRRPIASRSAPSSAASKPRPWPAAVACWRRRSVGLAAGRLESPVSGLTAGGFELTVESAGPGTPQPRRRRAPAGHGPPAGGGRRAARATGLELSGPDRAAAAGMLRPSS